MSYNWRDSDRIAEMSSLLKEHFKQTPSIVKKHQRLTSGEDFVKYDQSTATALVSTGDDIQQLFRIDFKRQLATIFTLQANQICSTETKRLRDMPSAMVQKAQQSLKTTKTASNRALSN